jgi:ABC-type branched-subunit amino acid transport system substrate-binding protein
MTRRRSYALLAVTLLVASSCGSRLDAAQEAALAARRGGGGGVVAAGNQATATTTPGGGASAAPSAGSGSNTGSSGGAGGESAAGTTGGGGGAPCSPEGASDVGITPDTVRIASVVTISGPVPGLGQTMANGIKAFAAYKNSQGGICGRKIDLSVADDRLDAGVNRSETQRLASDMFAFVAGWSVVDDGGASVLAGTNIPDLTLSLSDTRRRLPNNFSANPLDPNSDRSGTSPMMQWFHDNMDVRTGAIVFPAQAVARNSAFRFANDMAAAGITLIDQAEVAVTQVDFNGVASQFKNSKPDLVITTLENNGIARLAQAFRQQGFLPKVPFYGAQAYGRDYLRKGGDAVNGTIIGIAYSMAEDAPDNPTVATFKEWYERTNPGADLDFFAIQGWAYGQMFADALESAGPSPTRDAVIGYLAGLTEFDAEGLIGPVNPAGKQPSPCFAIVTVEGGAWKRIHPASGFQC